MIFWQDLPYWLLIKLLHDFYLQNQHKLFGFENCNGVVQFVNGLLIYARFLIYRSKYSDSRPDMAQYFILFDSIKQSEYVIAKRKINRSYTFGNGVNYIEGAI